jgi:hypothetical protein
VKRALNVAALPWLRSVLTHGSAIAILSAIVALATLANSADAMEFSIVSMPDGLRVILARGAIVAGDLERFRVALESADRDPYGNKSLALDSVGGLVTESFAIVALMDRERVTTIVPPDAICASACAQIIFLAGSHHIVLDGGRLGMHSCSANGDSSPLCNEEIAQNALSHGTEYGSVMAFMKYTAPSDVIWFSSTDADCWGLTKWPPSFGRGKKEGAVAPCVAKAIRSATHPSAQ